MLIHLFLLCVHVSPFLFFDGAVVVCAFCFCVLCHCSMYLQCKKKDLYLFFLLVFAFRSFSCCKNHLFHFRMCNGIIENEKNKKTREVIVDSILSDAKVTTSAHLSKFYSYFSCKTVSKVAKVYIFFIKTFQPNVKLFFCFFSLSCSINRIILIQTGK